MDCSSCEKRVLMFAVGLSVLLVVTARSGFGAFSQQRFSQTVDFILEEIERDEIDKEFLSSLPRKFKRSAVLQDKEDKCIDNIGTSHCKYLKRHQACFTHTARMRHYCNKTCGFCVPKTAQCMYSKYGCCRDNETTAKGYRFAGCKESCYDKYGKGFCKTAKQFSLCSSRNKGITIGCKQSCGLCRPCMDETPAKCKTAKLYNLCKKLKFTMQNQCRKTCEYCGDNDPCGVVSCSNNKKCIVNKFGDAECICKDKCKKGDHYTGTVCGRDGIEYANLCKLKLSSCNGDKKKVKWFGKCKPEVSKLSQAICARTIDDSRCKMWKRFGACKQSKWQQRMTKSCPHTCGMCAALSNRPACYYSKHGCCLDDYTQCQGPNYEGCNQKRPCRNKFRHLCKRFIPACGQKTNKLFMKLNCPFSCHYCAPPGEYENYL